MKKFIASAITFVFATAATAGSIIYTAPESLGIEEPERMGGSGAWLIPLIVAAVILLALTQSNDEPVDVDG